MSEEACVFCKIVAGRVHQAVVLERAAVIAFMDLRQPREGHVLIVPKAHIETIFELDRDTGAVLMEALAGVARAVRDAFEPEGISIWQSNGPGARQEVPHIHFHVMPRFAGDDLLRVYPSRPARPAAEELERQAAIIRGALSAGPALPGEKNRSN